MADEKQADPTVTPEALQAALHDQSCPIAKRIRSVFLLRQLGGKAAIDALATGLRTNSVLLSHEVAYVMGQMQDPYAVPYLTKILECADDHPIVRHEAAEALAAIGERDSLELLMKYCKDPCQEVATTCELAVERLKWNLANKGKEKASAVYHSVDPAPPSEEADIARLQSALVDTSKSMFDRYRAMFKLRNIGSAEAVEALATGFAEKESALFRHEIAYVMGQLCHAAAVPSLQKVVATVGEHAMVRHEAAEALGAIGTEGVVAFLEKFQLDEDKIVSESCDVALDLADYYSSSEVSTALPEK
mmetsp:Transcript_18583/g.20735  ORF Transcript_18583/g.20735 Transcript_18583/m.20735 type:complete len:304 (-) Transcript_18583:221-1132(-)